MPESARLLAGSVQQPVAIREQRARRLRVRVDEEGQDEDLGVPEHVREVGQAAETTRADGDRVLGGMSGAHQMIDGEAQRLLRGRIALDDHVAVPPALGPGGLVTREELLEAQVLRPLESPKRPAARGQTRARRHDGGEPVDGRGLAGLEAPADDVAGLLDGALDRRAGRRPRAHGEYVPAAVAATRARHEARVIRGLEGGLAHRPAGVRHTDRTLPDDAAREVLRAPPRRATP